MILAIDPGGSSVGLTIVDGTRVLHAECVPADDTRGESLVHLRQRVLWLAADHEPHPLRWAMEDASTAAMQILRAGRSSAASVRALCYAEAVCREACAAAGLGEPILVPPKSWKAEYGGGAGTEPAVYRAWIARLTRFPGLLDLPPDAAAAVGIGMYADRRQG